MQMPRESLQLIRCKMEQLRDGTIHATWDGNFCFTAVHTLETADVISSLLLKYYVCLCISVSILRSGLSLSWNDSLAIKMFDLIIHLYKGSDTWMNICQHFAALVEHFISFFFMLNIYERILMKLIDANIYPSSNMTWTQYYGPVLYRASLFDAAVLMQPPLHPAGSGKDAKACCTYLLHHSWGTNGYTHIHASWHKSGKYKVVHLVKAKGIESSGQRWSWDHPWLDQFACYDPPQIPPPSANLLDAVEVKGPSCHFSILARIPMSEWLMWQQALAWVISWIKHLISLLFCKR